MKKIYFIILGVAIVLGGFFYFRYEVYFSHGSVSGDKIFEVSKGEGNGEVGTSLRQDGFISGSWYFYYYIKTHGLLNRILPGKYKLNGNMTIPEIALVITNEKNILPGYVEITFPEGLTIQQMADKINANELDGQGFLGLAKDPSPDLIEKFNFLQEGKSLEGYLFPDTYYFSKEIDARGIIVKILDNFNNKLSSDLRKEIAKQQKTLSNIITMASIVEKEVSTDNDRAIVAGLFWNRIASGQALQSDATLSYALNDKVSQHSLTQTKTNSPYNTYLYKGLPPGPICNPGLSAIEAAIHPQKTDFVYFLSDPKTGQTIFSKTFAEHVANRNKYGL